MPIDFALTPEQQKIKDVCRELAQEFPSRSLQHDEERSIPVENFELMRQAGLYGVALSKELGGLGVGTVGVVAAMEEIAAGDGSTALGFNMHVNATGGISTRDEISDELKERVAKLAVEDGKLMATSVSEPTSSSLLPSTYNPTVEARAVDGGFRLYGRKFFCSIFEASDYVYLYAHPEDSENKAHAMGVLVESKQDEISVTDVWNTLGMRGTRSNQIDYDGAFVPSENVLYETDSFVESFIINEAPWSFGGYTACYCGVGLGIVDWAKKQLSTRKVKGYAQEMGYYPTNSHRFGEMVADMEAARLMVYRAAWETDVNGLNVNTFNAWVRAKLAVGNAVQRTVNNVVVACGVHSLFKKELLEVKLRDAATAPVQPPNSDACAEMVGLLTLGLDPSAAPSLRMLDEAPAPA